MLIMRVETIPTLPNKNDVRLMSLAVIRSQMSECISTRVGAVLGTPEGDLLAYGENNTASKHHCCSVECKHLLNTEGKLSQANRPTHSEWSNANEIHAEVRVFVNAHIKGVTLQGATLYTTASPCDSCAKHIELYAVLGAVSRVVYLDKYDRGNDLWIERLQRHGVTVDKMERQDLEIDFDKIIFSNVE
ncbi:deoxycytidylate deaminase [Pantoea phage Phynn]|nr:deoxycytidylate deaminase [Pantoea phage Phynn]